MGDAPLDEAVLRAEVLEGLQRRGLVEGLEEGRVDVSNAALPAKRKAALVVAALLDDSVPDSVPRDIRDVIVSYL